MRTQRHEIYFKDKEEARRFVQLYNDLTKLPLFGKNHFLPNEIRNGYYYKVTLITDKDTWADLKARLNLKKRLVAETYNFKYEKWCFVN